MISRHTALLLAAALMAGCSLKPYKLDIQQGIVLDADMMGRLKEGMSRQQVGYVLGTPLLTDPFHANRWDYVYYTRKQGKLDKPKHLTLFFKDDKLARLESDYDPHPVLAPAAPAVAPAAAPAPEQPAPQPPSGAGQ
jgi:outer membrane protein assembly factor BamE